MDLMSFNIVYIPPINLLLERSKLIHMKNYTLTDGGESLINQLIKFIPNDLLPAYTHNREADYVFHSVFGKNVLKHKGFGFLLREKM